MVPLATVTIWPTVPANATPSASICGAPWPGCSGSWTPTATIRAVVIAGAGGEAFSAGADIADFEAHRSDSVKGRGYNEAVDGLLQAAAEMATPTISMVQGFAAGGGCELAVATDLRIAGEGSRLGIPVARLGITIGHREMRGLVDLVGKGNALYILLSGRLLDAHEALRIGLVNQVVPAEELEAYTYRLANEIAALAPLSHAVNKETLRQVQLKPSLSDLTPEEADLPLNPVRHPGLPGGLPGLPGKTPS